MMEKMILEGLSPDFGLTYRAKENYSFADYVFSSYLSLLSKLE